MYANWKKWFKWQVAETKKYFDLNDTTRKKPPLLVVVSGSLVILTIALLILG